MVSPEDLCSALIMTSNSFGMNDHPSSLRARVIFITMLEPLNVGKFTETISFFAMSLWLVTALFPEQLMYQTFHCNNTILMNLLLKFKKTLLERGYAANL